MRKDAAYLSALTDKGGAASSFKALPREKSFDSSVSLS